MGMAVYYFVAIGRALLIAAGYKGIDAGGYSNRARASTPVRIESKYPKWVHRPNNPTG